MRAKTQNPSSGTHLFEQGRMMSQLKAQSPEHYELMQNVTDQYFDKSPGTGSALSVKVGAISDNPALNIGIIFLRPEGYDWNTFLPTRVSKSTTEEFRSSGKRDQEDANRYIGLPHEVGHLIDLQKRGEYIFNSELPLSKILEKALSKPDRGKARDDELSADKYAQHIFERATKEGLTANPLAFQRFSNLRVLYGLDLTTMKIDSEPSHSTGPFMQGYHFHNGNRAEYDRGAAALSAGMSISVDQILGQHVQDINQNPHTKPVSIWDRKIDQCFRAAADRSYSDANPEGSIPSPHRLSFSDSFRACVTWDFATRYKLLQDQFIKFEPGSTERAIIQMYSNAAHAELQGPDLDIHGSESLTRSRVPNAPPAPGAKP